MTAGLAAPRARECSCPVPLPCQCGFATLLLARLRALRPGEPLVRNGQLLAASSVVAAALGSVFWVCATRWYDPATVGRSYAAISAVGLLSALGRFNLDHVLTRFLPTAGRHTRRLVLRCYAVSAAASALAAALFLLAVPWISPALSYLRTPGLAVAFTGAAAAFSLFVLQDGALTGLGRMGWVLGENSVFALAKAVLLAACAALAVTSGILLSWAGAMVVAIALTNVVLFRHAVPAHHRADRTGAPAPERVARYATADYLGNLAGIAASSTVPLLVLGHLGAEQNAYYSLAYVISDTLYVIAFSMGGSLVVEAARAPERLGELARRMLRHSGLLLIVATATVALAAPWILRLFGPGYAEHGATALRLMALSALPNAVLAVAIGAARVRRALGWLFGAQLAFAAMLLSLVLTLLPALGLTGVGLAWLLTSSLLALGLLLTLPRWLPSPSRSTR
ncbi:hypothetical protein CFP65_6459 [Kitasatospora sp. MMS16-BH015]|uniref:lipopolysaccharide biosynthesis protein n=1 Tax=Kitasatospora sp. MMS16-BH015 TaxID=2018025 RepID=UPI000CA2707E|nr:hypothetical protein [Kitasatospora sp. MMS16-BH015]AUG81115.1 hypothetical protein CFP65_6459 [Kitasatospora sp. MMS16-BH015]